MIAWNSVLGRENTPHFIKLRVSCYVRPLRHSVPSISSPEWANLCPWDNHTPVFFKPLVVSICIMFIFHITEFLDEPVASVFSLQSVYLGFFRGMNSVMLRWKCFQNTSINIPALLVPLFLFPVGMD